MTASKTGNATAASRDAAAFVTAHQRGLWRWLLAIGCEADRAEEHCQDALLAALHGEVDAWERGAAARWLRTAARNLFLMRLRRERRRPEVALDEVEVGWLAAGGDRDGGDAALAALQLCLQAAPARDRELVQLRYRDDASRAAMAAATGLGAAGVKQALRRARARLQACVELRLAREQETR